MLRHDANVRTVLNLLKKGKWVLVWKKCELFAKKIHFCGHILEGGTRSISPGRFLAMEKWPLPKDVTSLRAFLGYVNHFHQYIPGFAELAASLQEKLKLPRTLGKKGSKHPVVFSENDVKDFEELKKRFCEGVKLSIPNPNKPFIIRTDASNRAVGGVIEQLDDDQELPPPGSEDKIRTRPIAFFSRKLTSGQIKTWPVREKEAYAIVSILKKHASLFNLQPILVLTDHRSLENWTTEVLDQPGGPTGRRARWHLLLSKFKLEIRYIKGEKNPLADALSRWAYPAGCGEDQFLHGTPEDAAKLSQMVEQEKNEEAMSYLVSFQKRDELFPPFPQKNRPKSTRVFQPDTPWLVFRKI